jgi:TetR/AcrR family transcriptional regulator, transcriptional repressor for nem operon
MKQENDTKQKLLSAAMELIWESSYNSVSVDDICAKAGVNKGSFYHAFKSKADLAVAAFEDHWEAKRPVLDQIFSPQVSPLERLDNYCQMVIKDQKEKYRSFGKMLGCPFCSVGSELSTQDEKIRLKAEQLNLRLRKYLESLVRDLAAEGIIESKDIPDLAQEIFAYTVGALLQAKIENSMSHVERLPHGVMRLLGIKNFSQMEV